MQIFPTIDTVKHLFRFFTKYHGFHIYLCLSIFSLFACQKNEKETIKGIVNKYDGFILGLNADSIASMYTQNGEMGEEGQETIKGRENIKQFLKSFKNIKVLTTRTLIDSVKFEGMNSVVMGRFEQKVLVDKDTFQSRGDIMMVMTKGENQEWKITKMITKTQK